MVRRRPVARPHQADGAALRERRERRVADPIDDDDVHETARRAGSGARTPCPGAASATTADESNREQEQGGGPAGPSVLHSHRCASETTRSPSRVSAASCCFEQLLEARCALERGEAGRALQPLLTAAPYQPSAAGSRDRRGRADESAEQKVARSPARPPRLHGTIVPCGSQRSVTYCSTWSCCSRSRSRRAATCAPRTGPAREARRPTSRRGRPSSVRTRACIAKRGDDPAGELVARELAARGVELVGPVGRGSDRRRRLDRPRRRPLARLRPRRRAVVRAGGARRGVARVRRPPPLRLRARCGSRSPRRRSSRPDSRASRARASRSTSPRGPRSAATGQCSSASSSTSSRRTSSSRPRPSGNCSAARTSARRSACSSAARAAARVFTEDAKLDFAAVDAEVVDPTGAGDALAAGFLLGGSLEEAARRGLEAAARCVAKVGSLP